MSFKATNNPAERLAGNLHSEYIFDNLAVIATENELIKLKKKQKTKLMALHDSGCLVFKRGMADTVVMNRNTNVFKHMLITPDLPGAPIYESNKSSQNMIRAMHVFEIMQYFADKRGLDLNSAMLTFSFENADFGDLSDAEQSLKLMYGKLKNFMRTTMNWGNAEFFGALPRMETTLNKKKVNSESRKGIYHPHLHVLLFWGGKGNIRSLKSQLWQKYSSLCAKNGVKVSPKAFSLEKSFDGKADKADRRQASISAIAEAMKYAIKPSIINMLEVDTKKYKGDDIPYKVRIFAEMYNAQVNPTISKNPKYRNLVGKKATRLRSRGSGLYAVALEVYNAIVESGYSALFAFQKCNGDMSRIPNVFTQKADVIVKNYVKQKASYSKQYQHHRNESGYRYSAEFANAEQLTLAETLYHNRQLLKCTLLPEKSIFDDSIKQSDNYNMSDKQQVVLDVINNFCSWNNNESDINEVIDEWIQTIVSNANSEGVYDFNHVDDLKQLKTAIHYGLSKKYMDNDNEQVRDFKNIQLAKLLGRKMLEVVDKTTAVNKLKALVDNESYVLLEDDQEMLMPVLKTYVEIKSQKHLVTDTSKEKAYEINDLANWKGVGNYDLTDQFKDIVYMLLFCLTDQNEDLRAEVECIGSNDRKIDLCVSRFAIDRMTNKLLKSCSSKNNSLFKDFCSKWHFEKKEPAA